MFQFLESVTDTMDPHPPILLGEFAPILRREWSRFPVKRAWLFGSRAMGEGTNESDWDFLIEFSEPPDFNAFMSLKLRLEQHLRGRVDILSRAACLPRFLKAIESQLVDVM